LDDYLLLGELSLDGRVKPIRGALCLAMAAKENKKKGVLLPKENAEEAAVVQGIEVLGIEVLSEAVDFLNGLEAISPLQLICRKYSGGKSSIPMISTRSKARST